MDSNRNSVFIYILDLFDNLKFYSNADEISMAYEGNVLSIHFYFYKLDLRVHTSYTKEAMQEAGADLQDMIMAAVNEEKDKKGVNHNPQED